MNEFNLAPSTTPPLTPGYVGANVNPVDIRNRLVGDIRATMPALPAVPQINLPPPTMPGMGPGARQEADPWTAYLNQYNPKTVDEYDALANQFKAIVLPQLVRKDSGDSVERIEGMFKALTDAQRAKVFPGQVAQAEQATAQAAKYGERNTSRTGDFFSGVNSGFATGINGLLGGIGAVYGGITGNTDNAATRLAQTTQADIDARKAAMISPQGQASQTAFNLAAAQKGDGGFADSASAMAGALVDNPGVLPSMLGETVGQMVPAITAGGIAATGKLALGKWGSLAVAGTTAGTTTAGSTGVQGEQQYRSAQFSDLIADAPKAKEIYDGFLLAGKSQATAEAMTRDEMVSRNWRINAPISGVVEALLAPLGAEASIITRLGRKTGQEVTKEAGRKVLGRIGVGAAKEAIPEGVTSGLQQVGENISTGQDLGSGVGGQVVMGTALGALLGGLTDGVVGKRPVGKKPVVDPAATADATTPPPGTPGATDPATAAESDTEALLSGTAAILNNPATEDAGGNTVKTLVDALNKRYNPRDKSSVAFRAAKGKTPAELINLAIAGAKGLTGGKANPDAKWANLSLQQRSDLVEGVYAKLVQGVVEEDARVMYDETIKEWKTQIIQPAQQVQQQQVAEQAAQQAPVDTAPVAPVVTAPLDIAPTQEEARAVVQDIVDGKEPKTKGIPKTATAAEALAKNTEWRNKLAKDFGVLPDEMAKIGANNYEAEYTKRTEAKAAARAADIAKAEAPKTAPAAQSAKLLLDSFFMMAAGMPDRADPRLTGLIMADPRYQTALDGFKAQKFNTPEGLKTFLEREAKAADAARVTATTVSKADTATPKQLATSVREVAKSKTLGKTNPVKAEAQELIKQLEALDLFSNAEISRLTLAQARQLAAGKVDVAPVVPATKKSAGRKPKPVEAKAPTVAETQASKPVEAGKKGLKKEASPSLASDIKLWRDTNGIEPRLTGYVEARKSQADGKFRLYAKSSQNELLPGRTFKSAAEAREHVNVLEASAKEETTATKPSGKAKLPDTLSKSAPRYSSNTLAFASDIDKALYIVGSKKTLSKADPAFRVWLASVGVAEGDIDSRAAAVRSAVKASASGAKPNTEVKIQEVTPPKHEAPAQVGAAQAVSEAPVKPKGALSLPKSVQQKVADILKASELTDAQKADVSAAVELAQENDGDFAELSGLIEEFGIDGKEAKALRGVALEKGEQAAKLEEDAIRAIIKEAEQGDPDSLEELRIAKQFELRNKVSEDIPTSTTLASKIRRILAAVKERTYTPEQAIRDIDELQGKQPARSAGVDRIKARLERERVAASPEQGKAIDFAMWLLDASPNIANRLSLTITDFMGSSDYSPARFLIRLNSESYQASTIVHEILHHAERLMPENIRNKIREEYFARLANKRVQADREGNAAMVDLIDKIYAWNADPNHETRRAMRTQLLQGSIDVQFDADAMYKYTEPSEYWAELGTEILARRNKDGDHWTAQLREWVMEFVEKVKNLLGLDNSAAVYKGLREVLGTDGVQKSDASLSERDGSFNEERMPQTEDTEVVTGGNPFIQNEAQIEADNAAVEHTLNSKEVGDIVKGEPWRGWERWVNNVISLENVTIALNGLAEKGKAILNANSNLDWNHRMYNSEQARVSIEDAAEVGDPVREYIAENFEKFGDSWDTAVANMNEFFGARNMQERLTTAYREEVALTDEAEIARETLLEELKDANGPEGTKAEAVGIRNKLARLVGQYAKATIEEHAAEAWADNQIQLDSLKKKGLTDSSMGELNKKLAAVRDRLRQRAIESGQVSEHDKIIDYYGWEWYVPQKAPSFANKTQTASATFDFTATRPSTKALHKELKAMQENARTSDGYKPVERLLIDLDRMAERSAYKQFVESIFNLIVDNTNESTGKNIFGAKIERFEGTPYYGYTDENGNTFSNLAHPKVGFVFNDGDAHYRVTLPDNSDIGRALLAMTAVVQPGKWMKKLGKATNVLARAYTTASPTWQLTKGFVRELTALPLTVAVELYKNPVEAAPLIARFAKNMVTSYGTLNSFIPTIANDNDGWYGESFKTAGLKEGSNQWWVQQYLANGGTMELSQIYEGGRRGVLKPTLKGTLSNLQSEEATLKTKLLDGVDVIFAPAVAWNHYTSNFAKFLETVPRAMMYKSLVESGIAPKEAGIRVRQVLDYGQTGLYSRNLNAVLAFSKTSLTSVDTMRRAFRDRKTGKTDWVKAATWSGAMAGVAMSAYFVMKAALGDDEDGIPRIHKFRPSTLTQKLIIPTDKDVPAVFELGLGLPQMMLAPGFLAAMMLDGHITPKEAAKEYLGVISRNGPLKVDGNGDQNPSDWIGSTVLGIVPTVLQPQVAIKVNATVFGSPIHSGFGKKNTPNYAEGKASTASEYADIAQMLYKMTGGIVNYYPEDIKYMGFSYGGQNARMIMQMAVDNNAKENAGYQVQNPFKAPFTSDEQQYYGITRIDTAMSRANSVLEDVNVVGASIAKEGGSDGAKKAAQRAYLSDKPSEAAVFNAQNALEKAQRQYFKEIRTITRDKLTSVERKKMQRKELDGKMREKIEALEKALETP